tara:strand:- start:6129 stop:6485 length:357 start_codon:yes stop_codon:yes gene_type:complete
MAKREFFKNGASFSLPIDGTFYTDIFAPDYEESILAIALYDSNGAIVTASAGTCVISISPINGQWQGPSLGSETIDLTLAGADATYVMPSFRGPQIQARIVLANVAGAVSASAFIWRN